jgi:hypothetical protein
MNHGRFLRIKTRLRARNLWVTASQLMASGLKFQGMSISISDAYEVYGTLAAKTLLATG